MNLRQLWALLSVLTCLAEPSLVAQVKVTVSPAKAPIPTRLAAQRFTFHLKIGVAGGDADLGGVPNQQLFGAQVLLQNVNLKNFDRREAIRTIVFPNQPASLTVSCGEGSQITQIKLDFSFVYQDATRTPSGQNECDVGGQVDLIILPSPRG